MHVGDRLAQILAEYGVRYVFGVPGGQTLPLYHGIMHSEGRIQHVLMRDERSAGTAADAHARITGHVAVCDATVGPGATNLVSPIAEAYCSSIPVLAITSDIPRRWEYRRSRGNASQAIRQVEMFIPITKWQVTLNDPSALDNVVDTAVRVATTGKPGPVLLNIPEDVFASPHPEKARLERKRDARFPAQRIAPEEEAIHEAAEMIKRSKMPALLVGGGALISGAFHEVRALAEGLNALVATTISGKGIIEETHPLAIGVAGAMGNPVANELLAQADLVILVGTKGGQIATFGWQIPKKGTPSIHVDLDAEEPGRNFPESLPLIGDARTTLKALLGALRETSCGSTWDLQAIHKKIRSWYEKAVGIQQSPGAPLKPQAVMDVLNRFITDDDLVICDASLASGWGAVYYRVPRAGRLYLAPRGIAGLGWGAPAAIGAALATDRRQRVIMLAGDGGFAYSLQELEVMRRMDLPVVSVIFNNDTLAWIKHVQKSRFKDGFISSDFSHVDFATVAQGFGARGYTANTLEELATAMDREQSPQGPAVIDVMTDQWETPVLRFSSGGA